MRATMFCASLYVGTTTAVRGRGALPASGMTLEEARERRDDVVEDGLGQAGVVADEEAALVDDGRVREHADGAVAAALQGGLARDVAGDDRPRLDPRGLEV